LTVNDDVARICGTNVCGRRKAGPPGTFGVDRDPKRSQIVDMSSLGPDHVNAVDEALVAVDARSAEGARDNWGGDIDPVAEACVSDSEILVARCAGQRQTSKVDRTGRTSLDVRRDLAACVIDLWWIRATGRG